MPEIMAAVVVSISGISAVVSMIAALATLKVARDAAATLKSKKGKIEAGPDREEIIYEQDNAEQVDK